MSTFTHNILVDSRTLRVENPASIEYRSEVPIELWTDPTTPHKRWQVALFHMTCYNSQHNVSERLNNNVFVYSTLQEGTRVMSFDDGIYTVDTLNSVLHSFMRDMGDFDGNLPNGPEKDEDYPIWFVANPTLNKIEVRLNDSGVGRVTIDWEAIGHYANAPSKFRYLFGFNNTLIDSEVSKYWISDFAPDMTAGIDTYNVELNCIKGSQRNGRQSSILYSFTPDAPPGGLVVVEPKNLMWMPISVPHYLQSFTIRLISNKGELLDLAGEQVTYTLAIKYSETT